MDDCLPRNVVRGRRLDSCGKRNAGARQEQTHNRGPRVDRNRGNIFWRGAFSAPDRMPWSPARKTDALVDSGASAHWLFNGRNSAGCRGKHSASPEDEDGGNLSWYLDCVAGLVHLWTDPDRADI